MNLITITNLTKSFSGFVILDKLNFSLNSNEKMAIVGRNGAGKSTLSNIINRTEPYDSGSIIIASNLKIGYFSQESFIDSKETVYNEMKHVFKKQLEMKQELERLEQKLNNHYDEEILNKYTNYLQIYESIGGYETEYKIENMLNRFGFKEYYHHPVSNLSGGQRTRLALVKLLLEEPDILMLDEPTNHLDLETVEFLESFLKAYKNAVILISHDRYFLNQVVNVVYEIEFNKGTIYKGNYDDYLSQKESNFLHMQKQYEIQQKMIQKEQEFIDKNLVRATTSTRAKSRRKKLEKVERLDNPTIDDKNIKVNFDFNKHTGNIVLRVEDLTIGYSKPIVKHISFLVKKQEKVAIIGPNGIGKSTLLRTINQAIDPLEGEIKYGSNVNMAYFDQDLAMLNSNKTVIDELWDEHRMMLERDVRTLLGSFLFTGEDVYKSVNSLSGGEKVRLALSKLILKKANLLILDEVTNHLDILSREVLEDALIDYEGTIIFVSHDRYFINEVATRIIEITHNEVMDYQGNYAYYVEKKSQLKEQEIEKNNKNNTAFHEMKKQKSEMKKQQKQIETLEAEISELEQEIQTLSDLQLKEEVYTDFAKANDVKNRLDALHQLLDEKINLWSELQKSVEVL